MKKLAWLWRSHGTRIMGWVVAILGALQVFEDQAMVLWWSDRGDLLFEFWVDVSNYMLMGAGAVIIRRGYTNARREGETPVVPGEGQ
jgi:hypothetical protein